MDLQSIKPGQFFEWYNGLYMILAVHDDLVGLFELDADIYRFAWTTVESLQSTQFPTTPVCTTMQFDKHRAWNALTENYIASQFNNSERGEVHSTNENRYNAALRASVESREIFTDEDRLIYALGNL